MDEKGLGKRLQEMRQAAGYTQQELCARAKLSYSTLAKIERGAIKSPSIFTIQCIARALGIGLDALLGIQSNESITEVIATSNNPNIKRTSQSGVRFVYFDLNDCLVRFSARGLTQLAHDSNQPIDVVESVYWQYNEQVCRGAISLDELNTVWAERLGIMVDWKKYYLKAVQATPGIAELVEWVAQNYHVGILSNTMPTFIPSLLELGRIPAVSYDAIIDSSVIKAIKPEPAIFEAAQAQSNFSAGEILLIDDDRANLVAAKKQGWKTIGFDQYDPERTIAGIREALA